MTTSIKLSINEIHTSLVEVFSLLQGFVKLHDQAIECKRYNYTDSIAKGMFLCQKQIAGLHCHYLIDVAGLDPADFDWDYIPDAERPEAGHHSLDLSIDLLQEIHEINDVVACKIVLWVEHMRFYNEHIASPDHRLAITKASDKAFINKCISTYNNIYNSEYANGIKPLD